MIVVKVMRLLVTLPGWVRAIGIYLIVLALLLLLEQFSFIAAQVPLTITTAPTSLTLALDGSSLRMPVLSAPTYLVFVEGDPTVREFQLDGTDSINNFSQDAHYINGVANTPYYRFQAWMRDFTTYSSWRDITVRNGHSGSVTTTIAAMNTTTLVALPPGGRATVAASIERLEVPVQIVVLCGTNACGSIQIDRNNRFIRLQSILPDGSIGTTQQTFFPEQPLPFIAAVAYLLIHVAIWSLLVLGILLLFHTTLCAFWSLLDDDLALRLHALKQPPAALQQRLRLARKRIALAIPARLLLDKWDIAAACVALLALGFTCWIALTQYLTEPHILDASAYFFQAKIFASGQLSAPVPANLAAFQGPFMIADQGRWFAQYPPATSALLAVGVILHAPWISEPLLGALALWGIYKIGRLLFAPHEALFAVILGALSPFYLYLAASYLSHTISLFFGVYFLLSLLLFNQRYRQRDLVFAALCAGGLLLTRELTTVLLCGGATLLVIGLHWRGWRDNWQEIVFLAVLPLSIMGLSIGLYFSYNALQTGNPFLLPRTVFYPADLYGFGQGIGFYGQHTLAAGFVVLDQLLTILLIDLYGWPFYFTLAFVSLAFIRRLRYLKWDLFCLLLAVLLIGAQVGYFYHGIFLGPRYLFDALPFLLLLSARGVSNLFRLLVGFAHLLFPALRQDLMRTSARLLVVGLVIVLISGNVLYYLPRQIALYQDYSGLPVSLPVQVATIYAFHPEHAVVVTDSALIYNYVLFPLNEPNLNGATLYAYSASTITLQQLEQQYPDRTFYLLHVGTDGTVTFLKVVK